MEQETGSTLPEQKTMLNRNRILIGSNIFAAVCFGFVSYSNFYEGKPGQGLIFLLLTISQLLLGIANISNADKMEKRDL